MDMTGVWSALLGPGWLDVGNGWRNLFLLSCILQAGALGTAFAIHGWFSKGSRVACFLTGVAATPFVQYLWTLLLAFAWPNAPKPLYIGFLPALAGLYWLFLLIRHFRRIPALLSQGMAFGVRVLRFDKASLVSLCFALALSILLLPVCVRLCSSMNAAGGGDAGEYLGLAVRFCEDRDLGALLEKEETVGHFRGHGHFPSLELYMGYTLMHTGGDYGYPNDKPAFTSIGILTFYMIAAYLALLLVLTRERKRWVLLGILLLNLVPNLYFSVNGAPRDIWRILAVFLAALFFAGLRPLGAGGWKAYLGKLIAALVVCFTVMSAHVVCFVILPFIVVAWVFSRWYDAALMKEKKAWRELLTCLPIALSGALGTLIAFSGNLWCYLKWGEMSPWRLMTTFTSAPWYEAYMLGEYKLEETTTRLDFWKARYDIVMAYATPIGLWGMRLGLVGLVCGLFYLLWRKHSKGREMKSLLIEGLLCTKSGPAWMQTLTYAALLTLCTLAPMTGLLDTKLYSFSGSFLALQRYTLQWFMLAAIMICAAFASLEGAWPYACEWISQKWGKLLHGLAQKARGIHVRQTWQTLPALLCAALCVLAFAQGVKQTGYTTSFYRYSRDVMEDAPTLLDKGFLERYGLLMTAARHVPENGKILLTRAGYQYPLRAKGYILTANPVVSLMNLSAEELPNALARMNVCMLATEPDFWDERYFSKSALSNYLNALPEKQILQDGAYMRLYILDPQVAQDISEEIQAQGNPPPLSLSANMSY